VALTINASSLTTLTTADSATGWSVENLAAGSGIDTDQNIQGNGCYAGKLKSTSSPARIYYTFNSVNMVGQLLRIWLRFTELSKYETTVNNGICIYIEDGTGNNGEWNIGGSDSDIDEAWNNYVMPVSAEFDDGTANYTVNRGNITKVGVSVRMTSAPAKAENIFVDAIRYGPGLTITGTNTLEGSGFKEIADADNTTANKYGVFTRNPKTGVYSLRGELIFGDSSGTSSVNFTDYKNSKIVTPKNLNVIPAFDWGMAKILGSLDNVSGFTIAGNSTGTTDFQLGKVVGTGNDRQGISGGVIFSPMDRFFFDAETYASNIDSVQLNGVTFEGAGNIQLSSSNQSVVGCTFSSCDEIQANDAEVINCRVIAPAYRGTELTSSHDLQSSTYVAGTVNDVPIEESWIYDYIAYYYEMSAVLNGEAGTSNIVASGMNANNAWQAYGLRNKFGKLTLNVAVAQAGGVLEWRYWNGSSWTALDVLYDDTTQFTTVGENSIEWAIPTDWTRRAIDRGKELYYVCAYTTNWVSTYPEFYPNGNSLGLVIEDHVHFPSSGNYTCNYFEFYGHPSSPGFPQWHVENSSAATTANSYGTGNQSGNQALGNGTINGVGQSFTGTGNDLSSVSFYLSVAGTPTGNVVAKLYDHSGTLGTDSIPTGNALATSNTLNVEDRLLTSDIRLINFEFDDGYTLNASTNYVVTLEYSDGDTSNYINVGTDITSPAHGGNLSTLSSGTWSANSSADTIFYVFTGAKVNISATGGNMGTKQNSNASPGATKITNTVTVTVKAIDISDTSNVANARVYLKASSGGPLTEGTTILDPASQLTDSNGLVSDSFNYTGNQPVIGWVRQASSAPYYKEAYLSGTITSGGLSITAPMVRDQ